MSSYVSPVNGDIWEILLNPMQIRTFEIEIKHEIAENVINIHFK